MGIYRKRDVNAVVDKQRDVVNVAYDLRSSCDFDELMCSEGFVERTGSASLTSAVSASFSRICTTVTPP